MMKLAIFALVALLGVALAEKENKYEKEGHFYHHGRRLGVFSEAPFVDLYKKYAHAFVIPNIFPPPELDDLRNFRPSADVCSNFFTKFVNMDHKINDFDELVVLDACLAYVLEGVYLEEVEDKTATLSDETINNFNGLRKSPKITSLYQTKMGDFTAKERTCVADLLFRDIGIKNQFRGVRCNNHIVQSYIQFAECQSSEKMENLRHDNVEDPYVKMIYELLKERAISCFEQEAAHIENAVRARFYDSFHVIDSLPFASPLRKQRKQYKWPKEISELLAAIQNTNKIGLRQVNQIISFYTRNDEKMKKMFLDHLAEYADRKVGPHRKKDVSKKTSPEYDDPYGSRRYTQTMDKLCNPFRVSESENRFSFALSIIRLVQLLEYPQLFHISEDQFLKRMVEQSMETAPVYIATQACNLISYTQGTYDNTGVGVPKYKVSFKADSTKMVTWPLIKNI